VYKRQLLDRTDQVLVGGALSYTFLKSLALPVGASFVEKELEVNAFQTTERANLNETELMLPVDHVAAEQFSKDSKVKGVASNGIPDRWMALDIGSKTISKFDKVIKKAGSVFWYGPMGAIEIEKFRKGSQAIAQALAKTRAHTVAAGTDTLKCIYEAKVQDKFSHLSVASETTLAYLMGETLPGITALREA